MAVLAVPQSWRPGAGFMRIAVGYDGSEPADAAIEATRALVVARRGGVSRVELVHVDESASSAGEVDADVVDSRRTAVIEWWLAQVGRAIPAPVAAIRRCGDPVTALAELSSDVDLLIVGTDGRGSLRRLVGGSVFTELVEASQCPILIVPQSSRARLVNGDFAQDHRRGSPGRIGHRPPKSASSPIACRGSDPVWSRTSSTGIARLS
jgi:nucleotide-binding universal stress UspA family protein